MPRRPSGFHRGLSDIEVAVPTVVEADQGPTVVSNSPSWMLRALQSASKATMIAMSICPEDRVVGKLLLAEIDTEGEGFFDGEVVDRFLFQTEAK